MASAGTAAAAKVLITSSAQIKKGAVNGSDIADGSITGRDFKKNVVDSETVRNGSISLDDLASHTKQALDDAGTQALEAFRKDGPVTQPADKMSKVATLANIPPGTYAIFAKTIITADSQDNGLLDSGKTSSAHCILDAGGDKDEARALLATPGSNSPGVVNMQITRSYGATGTATLECLATSAPWRATDSSIIALRVGKAPRQPVEG